MPRRTIFGLASLIAIAGPLPAVAECPPPVEPGSPAFSRHVRTLERNHWIVARGKVPNEVPAQAHNIWSVYLDVERYLVGSGPDRIMVTSEGDGLTVLNRQEPGSATAESRAALRTMAGKDAIVFAKPEQGYEHGYVTTLCTWTRFGDGVDTVESHLRAALGMEPLPEERAISPWLLVLGALLLSFATTAVLMAVRRARNTT